VERIAGVPCDVLDAYDPGAEKVVAGEGEAVLGEDIKTAHRTSPDQHHFAESPSACRTNSRSSDRWPLRRYSLSYRRPWAVQEPRKKQHSGNSSDAGSVGRLRR
jgi:hypothetical protein